MYFIFQMIKQNINLWTDKAEVEWYQWANSYRWGLNMDL